jgi:hypothetical protein
VTLGLASEEFVQARGPAQRATAILFREICQCLALIVEASLRVTYILLARR